MVWQLVRRGASQLVIRGLRPRQSHACEDDVAVIRIFGIDCYLQGVVASEGSACRWTHQHVVEDFGETFSSLEVRC